MNTVQLRYAKRIVPVQYEYEELEINFGVDCDENLRSRTEEMKRFVNDALYGKIPTSTITSTNSLKGETHGNSQESKQESNEESNSSKGKKSRKSKSEVVTATAETTTEEMEEVESPYKADAPSEPSKEVAKTETKTTKAAGKKVDAILYDRENADHRSTMTNFLTKLTGGKEWANDKERSKKASQELTGQPFMDKAGEILPSFKELCSEKFGVSSDSL